MGARVIALSLAGWAALAAAAAGPDCAAGAPAREPGEEAFRADLEALTRDPHRLAGTSEGRRAADYVLGRLAAMGLAVPPPAGETTPAEAPLTAAQDVFILDVPLWQTQPARCELLLGTDAPGGAAKVELLPVRPNILMPPVTPDEGLRGPYLYAGRGTLAEYGDRPCAGAIVGLEYDCDDQWERAFRMGAKAVIFLGGPAAQPGPAAGADHRATPLARKHAYVPANLVRLYAPAEEARRAGVDLRRDHPEVTVVSHVEWKRTSGRNVFAFLPGTNPIFDSPGPELVVLSANYDSFGVVPRLSPGARGAANVAALLEATAWLKENRPRRDVLVAFLDGQARSFAGARAFYTALTLESGQAEKLAEAHRQEKAFVEGILALLRQAPGQWNVETGDVDAAKDALSRQADHLRADLNVRLMQLRRRAEEEAAAGETPEMQEVDDLRAMVSRWDAVRRALHGTRRQSHLVRSFRWLFGAADPEAALGGTVLVHRDHPALYAELVEATAAGFARRRDELAVRVRIDEQGRRLRTRLADRTIVLHTGYNLSGEGPTWGVVVRDALHDIATNPNADSAGHYAQVLAAFREAAESFGAPETTDAAATGLASLDTKTLSEPTESRRYAPGRFVSDGRVAGVHGIYNVSLMTGHDRRPRDGHPADTVDRLAWRELRRHAAAGTRLLARAADLRALSLRRTFEDLSLKRFSQWDDAKKTATGNFAGLQVTGSLEENRPAAGALIAVWPKKNGEPRKWVNPLVLDDSFTFFDPTFIAAANADGRFELVGIQKIFFSTYQVVGAMFDSRGRPTAITNREEDTRKSAEWVRLNLFRCQGQVVGRPLMAEWGTDEEIHVLAGGSDTPFRIQRRLLGHGDDFAFFYMFEGLPGTVKVFHPKGPVFLGEPTRRATGDGFPFEAFQTPPPTDPTSAEDLWRLNEGRLSILRTRGIVAADLERLHGRAQRIRTEAHRADSTALRTTRFGRSAALSRDVYLPLKNVMNDLIRAIVLLLLLAIPFAFVMERLIVCATSIYTRLVGFAALFLVTFVLLFLTHPGFKIAATPIVILLAFLIILLSSVVIFIVTRKFQTELRAMQGQSSARHRVQQSRLSTLIAAVNMGISTMRRRPLRTVLTAVTVVMLTFTVMCFASLANLVGVREVYERPPGDDAAGLFLRKLDYKALSSDALVMLGGSEGPASPEAALGGAAPRPGADLPGQDPAPASRRAPGGGLVTGQWWLAPKLEGDPAFGVVRPASGASLWVDGVIGVTPEEVRRWPQMAELLQGETLEEKCAALAGGGVYLPRILRDQMDLHAGDPILVAGERCRFAGVLDDRLLQRLNHLDGRSALPVDFRDPSSAVKAEEKEGASEDVLAREFVRLSPNQVAIASADLVRRLGGRLHVVTVYPPEETDRVEAGAAAAEQTALPVWANGTEGVVRLVFSELTEVTGAAALAVPVLLGGLIIFGTMLGSIADREREIYSFSALGLAPLDVGFLFFAEAAVYAVVGGMAGQVLAQGVAQGTLMLAERGLIQPTNINFSSTNALFAIGIVMATVLASAIFPAYRASRSANPGLKRSWKMPPPEGDTLRMTFPFTVSAYDITGVVGYLAEHFRQHDDAGLGVFASRDVRIRRVGETDGLALEAELALAPFDLGVTQHFELSSAPSEVPGVEEVTVEADRLSGAAADWKRANRVFLHDLRRQFLLWRTLTPETVESYRMATLTALGEEEAEATAE